MKKNILQPWKSPTCVCHMDIWITLQITVLNERPQTMFPLYENLQKWQVQRATKHVSGFQGLKGRRNWDWFFLCVCVWFLLSTGLGQESSKRYNSWARLWGHFQKGFIGEKRPPHPSLRVYNPSGSSPNIKRCAGKADLLLFVFTPCWWGHLRSPSFPDLRTQLLQLPP